MLPKGVKGATRGLNKKCQAYGGKFKSHYNSCGRNWKRQREKTKI